MARHVLLLRGINVGGAGKLPMAELRMILARLGAGNVATCIQSGNAVFTSEIAPDSLGPAIADAINAQAGFRPTTLVLPAREFLTALERFPFPAALNAPKTGHVWFLSETPDAPDLDGLRALATRDEACALADRQFYLHAPSGIGCSKLATKVEKLLGVTATARNLNTIGKLADLLNALPM